MVDKKDIVLYALDDFPIIKQLIGEAWFKLQVEKDSKHPLIRYLSKGRPDFSKVNSLKKELKETKEITKRASLMLIIDGLQYDYNILFHLERCLKTLREETKLGRILDNLKNEEHFWSGYSEAEIASRLKGRFKEIELEPVLPNGKFTDIKFIMEDKWIFAEVTAARQGQKFKEMIDEVKAETSVFWGVASGVERARRKISEEYDHFRNIMDGVPTVIFVNTNQCEYKELEIEEALKGEVSRFEFIVNKETGEVLGGSWVREPWTVFDEDEKVELLGALVSYERHFNIEGEVIFEGKIFGISFSKEEMETLSQCFM